MPGTTPKRMRIISLTAASFVLLAFATAPRAAANEWLKSKSSVVLRASKTLIMIPCPPSMRPFSDACPPNGLQVTLTSQADGFRNPEYAYTAGLGRIVGTGNHVVWDLSGVSPGIYTATVEVRDNKKHRAASSVTVTVKECRDCVTCDGLCPPIGVICYDEVKAGTPITCKVVMPRSSEFKYVWSVRDSRGEDISGRLSSRGTYVSIPTDGLAGHTVYATVEIKGLDSSCSSTASSQTKVKP